ncbi:acyl transferase [Roseivirga sp. BDSF3-8]|uniref:acyl transferase n=1 Tax=Roseivirga sp. BDSF3-8 TaxID=3241598 RepID=UPI003531E160
MGIDNIRNNLLRMQERNFESVAMEVFRYQSEHNPVYKAYLKALGRPLNGIEKVEQIPFMPISFFKEHTIKSGQWEAEKVFESSRTTGAVPSRHLIRDLEFYHMVAEAIFERTYGSLQDFHILALLPGYLERDSSSLVYMVRHFMNCSNSPYSGFYLDDLDRLRHTLDSFETDPEKRGGRRVLLIGVTFALLDLAETYKKPLTDVIIMETGGMKGRRKEMVRHEVHTQLADAFDQPHIHSEYGMTELLSQAYAKEQGRFGTPPWMKLLIRDINDPFHIDNRLRSGGVNIVDLANIDSCAFIETQDVGRYHPQGGVEILGRMDNTDVRGCNLLLIR